VNVTGLIEIAPELHAGTGGLRLGNRQPGVHERPVPSTNLHALRFPSGLRRTTPQNRFHESSSGFSTFMCPACARPPSAKPRFSGGRDQVSELIGCSTAHRRPEAAYSTR
jgi:hypothetical protein